VIDAFQSLPLVLDTGHQIVNHGVLEATGGGGLTILDPVLNALPGGRLVANGGDVTLAGAVTGGGSASINGATLDFESASAAWVTFQGTTGRLELDNAAGYSGRIAGLGNGPGNTIDLTEIGFAHATANFHENGGNTAGWLTLGDGTHSAQLALLGQYASNVSTAPPVGYTGFVLADDGGASHGTLVSYMK
jgi:hypothetical protein